MMKFADLDAAVTLRDRLVSRHKLLKSLQAHRHPMEVVEVLVDGSLLDAPLAALVSILETEMHDLRMSLARLGVYEIYLEPEPEPEPETIVLAPLDGAVGSEEDIPL